MRISSAIDATESATLQTTAEATSNVISVVSLAIPSTYVAKERQSKTRKMQVMAHPPKLTMLTLQQAVPAQ